MATLPATSWTSSSTASSSWCDVVLPKEHGSWSLAFEPLALGLLAAPSTAGAWFGVAVAAGFLSRRPLRLALRETRSTRRQTARRALGICAGVTLVALAVAVSRGGFAWLVWLLPALICGLGFVRYDLRNDGREGAAEVAGAAAFACLPAVWAVLGGWSTGAALALAAVMLGRAVPTVIFVRAAVRGRKTGRMDLRGATAAAIVALVGGIFLAAAGLAPAMCVAWFGCLLTRIAVVRDWPTLRAKHLGMLEAVTGVAFVATTALLWR